MEIREFNFRLKLLGLTKKRFAELAGITYDTVGNWTNRKKTPSWAESWLNLYELAFFQNANAINLENFYERVKERKLKRLPQNWDKNSMIK